jgi:hypothetical protein
MPRATAWISLTAPWLMLTEVMLRRAARTESTSRHTVSTGVDRDGPGEAGALDEAPPAPVPPGEVPLDPQAAARNITAQSIAPLMASLPGVTRVISEQHQAAAALCASPFAGEQAMITCKG